MRLVCKDTSPKVTGNASLVTKSSSSKAYSIYSESKELLSDIKSLVANDPIVILSTSIYLYLVVGCLSFLGTTI